MPPALSRRRQFQFCKFCKMHHHPSFPPSSLSLALSPNLKLRPIHRKPFNHTSVRSFQFIRTVSLILPSLSSPFTDLSRDLAFSLSAFPLLPVSACVCKHLNSNIIIFFLIWIFWFETFDSRFQSSLVLARPVFEWRLERRVSQAACLRTPFLHLLAPPPYPSRFYTFDLFLSKILLCPLSAAWCSLSPAFQTFQTVFAPFSKPFQNCQTTELDHPVNLIMLVFVRKDVLITPLISHAICYKVFGSEHRAMHGHPLWHASLDPVSSIALYPHL